MNILILRLSSMGDVILATPLFSFLSAKYPSASLTFLTGSGYAGLFADDPRLAEVIGISGEALELPPELLGKKWDLVVDLQNNRRSHSLLRSVAAGSVTVRFDKMHWKRLVLLAVRCNLFDLQHDVAQRYIQAAGSLLKPGDIPPLHLFFKEDGCRKLWRSYVQLAGGVERPGIALFPFSAWRNKEWPSAYFIELGRYFLAKGWHVAILGGSGDAPRAGQMKERIGGACAALAGELSLHDCGSLLTGFSLAVGNDTGLSHLARAVGVKTGVLFGPTTQHFGFYPYGDPPFKVFEEHLLCRPCHAHGGNRCIRFNRRCLQHIEPVAVIEGLEELLRADYGQQ